MSKTDSKPAISLVDTHCHIHDQQFFDPKKVKLADILSRAKQSGVRRMICVGTDLESSKQAVSLAKKHQNLYSAVALHPHLAADFSEEELAQKIQQLDALLAKKPSRAVAIGECGLDYFYHQNSEIRQRQKYLLGLHLDLAQKYDLPLSFHIREAKDPTKQSVFKDFFEIFDQYSSLRGVLHSFSDQPDNMRAGLQRGLLIGLNGIMTFSKDAGQLQSAKEVPLDKLLLETDAPFLTPKPFRGKMCEPWHTSVTAEFLSELRGESLEELAQATTNNAEVLFNL